MTRSLDARRRSIPTAAILALTLALSATVVRGAPGREEIAREIHKTLPLKAGQRLEVEHSNGDVRLRGQSGPDVRVDARIRVSASDMDEAKKFADAIAVEINATASGVLVRTRYPEEKKSFFSSSRSVSFSVDYDIAVPDAAAVTVRNRFGDVAAEGLKGGSEIHGGNGRLSFKGGRGRVVLENAFGALELAGNAGDADVTNANGTVSIADVEGQLSARNRFGRVTIVKAGRVAFSGTNADVSLTNSGPATITTSFGTVTAGSVAGDLTIHNSNGAVTVMGVAGDLEVSGSFGAIEFSDVRKSVRCSGTNARVTGRKVGATVNLQNTFGPVELSDISGAVDVQNTNGAVRLRDIRGAAVVQNRFGPVDAAGIAGEARVTNTNGTVVLANVDGAVDARSSFGQVSVSRVKKGVQVTSGNGGVALSEIGAGAFVKTSFGLVEASRVGGDLRVENQNGPVRANDIRGSVDVRTSFSPVALGGIAGGIQVDNQNGSVEVRDVAEAGKTCNRIALKTSFAPIRLSLPPSGGYTVNARTSFGKIASELAVTSAGSVSGDSMQGRIGDGRCEVTLSNSNGNIDLLKQGGR